jgi:hypothetical protein
VTVLTVEYSSDELRDIAHMIHPAPSLPSAGTQRHRPKPANSLPRIGEPSRTVARFFRIAADATQS